MRTCERDLSIYLDGGMEYQTEWLRAAARLVTGREPMYSEDGHTEYWRTREAACQWAASEPVRAVIRAIAGRTAVDRLTLEDAIGGAPF